MARIQRAQLHPLHLRHHRKAQGRAARRRRLRGGAGAVDVVDLRHPPRPGVLLHLRHRLGGRPFLQRVRAADRRRDLDSVRRAADFARRRHLVEDLRTLRRAHHVFLADRGAGVEEAGSGVPDPLRPVEAAVPVPGRRTAGRADRRMDHRCAGQDRDRQLLADRDRLASAEPDARGGDEAGQARLAGPAGAWLQAAGNRREHRAGRGSGREGRAGDPAAVAAGLPDHGVGQRRPLHRQLLQPLQGAAVQLAGLGDPRRGRLHLHPRPHRRRDQRRRPSPGHARDRGVGVQSPAGGRGSRHWRARRAQGPGAGGVRHPQER